MILIAFVLGLRHGFDLDHLATIDSIARTIRGNRLLSKMTGFLFSLGHGLVVTAVSLIVGAGLVQAHIPEWLDGLGNWISLFFLVVFGALNLWNIFQKTPSDVPVGIKSFLVKKIKNKKFNPAMITLIGALFAFSFDTFSQVALFSLSGSLHAGWIYSGILGLFFTFGMMASDSLNGLLVAMLIQRADKASLIFSRSLGVAISAFSLSLAVAGFFKMIG